MYGLRPLRRSNALPVHGMPPVSDAGPAAQESIRVYLGPVEGPADLRLLSSARHETYESIFRVYRLSIQISRKALSAQWQRTLILSDSRRLTKIRAARLGRSPKTGTHIRLPRILPHLQNPQNLVSKVLKVWRLPHRGLRSAPPEVSW
jgi:hypothetical protein